MIRIVILCGLAIVGAKVATAQNIFGAGTVTCDDWLEYRNQNRKDHEFQARAWIDGFISGSNLSSPNGPDILALRTGDEMYAWIDNYCRAKPRDRLVAATWALVKELQSKAK